MNICKVPILIFLLVSCKSINFRTDPIVFESACKLYGAPDIIIELSSNNTFIYKMPYVDNISGNWTQSRDTLIFHSDKFPLSNFSESKPANIYNKYTNLKGGVDKFLMRGNNLIAINIKGVEKSCKLKKTKHQ